MRKCSLCNKKSIMVASRKKLRGKYNPVNWSRKKPNLVKVKLSPEIFPKLKTKKINLKFLNKRLKICTQCLKSLQKTT